MNPHSKSSRSARHGLSHSPHSQNAEDLATDLPSQEHVGAQGSPRPCSNQFLSLVSASRSTQQKQHSDVGRCFTVDTRGVGDWNFPASGGFQINMLKSHRVRGNDFQRGRDFLEKPRVQAVCGRDKQGRGSFGHGEKLLLAERKLVWVSSGVVIAVDTLFNFLRITAGYHQNGFGHAQHILLRAECNAKLLSCISIAPRATAWEGGIMSSPGSLTCLIPVMPRRKAQPGLLHLRRYPRFAGSP